MVASTMYIDIQNVRRQALLRRYSRDLQMRRLYPVLPTANPNDPLVTLANTFTRYASTQETAFDTGAARTSPTATANILERQVTRALSQVLGRSPGSTPSSFIAAINSTFPTTANGQISTTPSRSGVSLSGQDGATPAMAASMAAGLSGQISAEQAALYRQASIVAADALKVLSGLQPFAPEAESDRVAALRALIQSEITALVDEFGRVDEPRPDRVQAYLQALIGPSGHVIHLGQQALLDGSVPPATIDDESQIAGFQLLTSYARLLQEIWNNYNASGNVISYPVFSERLSRASVLLPVIVDGNNNFMAAMDSIGFTEAERRSSATRFTYMDPSPQPAIPGLPDMTVNDLNEWIDRFASTEGPANLADSGQYGLEFVTDQADTIFWVIARILGFTKTIGTLNLNTMPLLTQVLLHERVSWALDDLVNQFKSLADLAA